MLCDCGHGERTLGTCAHRCALCKGMRDKFMNQPFDPAHKVSTRMSQLQTNIEPDVVEDSAEDLGGIYDDYSDVDEDIDSDDDVFEYSD